jgi:sugar/nucleoside kinase (ribokinase family)
MEIVSGMKIAAAIDDLATNDLENAEQELADQLADKIAETFGVSHELIPKRLINGMMRGSTSLKLDQIVDERLENLISESDVVVMSAYTFLRPESRKFALDVLECVEKSEARMVIDAASSSPIEKTGADKVRKYLSRADLVLANEDEFAALAVGAPDNWTSEFKNLIVKRGERGALWLFKGQEVASVKAEPVKVLDTTGAGDAFCAGLLSQLRLRDDWENLGDVDYAQSLLVASHTAGENCKTLGATPVS